MTKKKKQQTGYQQTKEGARSREATKRLRAFEAIRTQLLGLLLAQIDDNFDRIIEGVAGVKNPVLNKSKFTVGMSLELDPYTVNLVQTLLKKHGLSSKDFRRNGREGNGATAGSG